MSRFQFVADHRDAFEVKWLCEIVEVSRSSFYAWLDAAPARAERAAADAALAERIRTVQRTEGTEYGAPRITAELNDGTVLGDDDRVNYKRVARVMREHGIAGLRLRRKVRTTVPEPSDDKVPDLLKRDFTATAPNTKYVGDITYLPYDGGHLYLATVIDCCSRRLVGWSIAEHMRTDLVQDALRAASANAAAWPARSSTMITGRKADSTGRRNTSTSEVADGGDGGLEQEDQRYTRGCASAVACRSGAAAGDALAWAA